MQRQSRLRALLCLEPRAVPNLKAEFGALLRAVGLAGAAQELLLSNSTNSTPQPRAAFLGSET